MMAFKLRQAAGDPEALAAVRREFGFDLSQQEEDPSSLEPLDTQNKVADVRPLPPAPPAISFEREVLRERGKLAVFEQLVESDPEGVFTLRSEYMEVDLEYLKRIDSVDTPTGMFVIRFLLPKSTSVRIRPSDELVLVCGSEELPVTFIGDMHDFGGLLPIKMISFFGKRVV